METETFLIVQRGEDIGRRYDLDTVQLTIGRGSDNDLVLNDPMVSRYHAVVKRQGGRFTIIDLGSANPVVVNDQVLEAGMAHPLTHRDVVFIGKTVFSFQSREGGQPANRLTPARESGPPPRPAERPAPPPMTPPPFPRAGAPAPGGGETMLGMPGAQRPAASANDDEGKTMVGGVQLGAPPQSQVPVPPPGPHANQEPSTNPALRVPPGAMPPLPPLGAVPPPAGPVTPPPLPPLGGPGAPPANAPRQGGQMIGTPPDDESGDSPTVFIPRDRH